MTLKSLSLVACAALFFAVPAQGESLTDSLQSSATSEDAGAAVDELAGNESGTSGIEGSFGESSVVAGNDSGTLSAGNDSGTSGIEGNVGEGSVVAGNDSGTNGLAGNETGTSGVTDQAEGSATAAAQDASPAVTAAVSN